MKKKKKKRVKGDGKTEMGCLNGEGVIGKHLMGREKIAF